MKNKLEEGYVWLFNQLKASCGEFVGLGYSLTGCYIRTYSGLAFKLEDYAGWSFSCTEYSKVRVSIGALHIDIESDSLIQAACVTNPAMLALGLIGDQKYPGSQNWYFVRKGQSIKLGTAYSPTEYYWVSDSFVDIAITGLAIAIIYAIIRTGLWVLGKIFARKVLTDDSIYSNGIEDMINDMKDVIDDNIDAPVSSRSSQSSVDDARDVVDDIKTDSTALKLDLAKLLSEYIDDDEKLEVIVKDIQRKVTGVWT